MKVNIIFLDFDGVLLNRNSYSRASGSQSAADPKCVAILNRIIEETGAHIVVTSTWRKGQSRTTLADILYMWGVKGIVRDLTPVLLLASRGEEIQYWIYRFVDAGREPLGQFTIIDDDVDMGELTCRLVRTNGEVGLTEQDADRAIAMLMEGIN